jgi:hypothetical protein
MVEIKAEHHPLHFGIMIQLNFANDKHNFHQVFNHGDLLFVKMIQLLMNHHHHHLLLLLKVIQ